MLRATRIPDDVAAEQLGDVSFDEREKGTQSQTNILTNEDGVSKVVLVEDAREYQNSNRSNKNPLVPQGLALKEKNIKPLKDDRKMISYANASSVHASID